MKSAITVNGRFLTQKITGVQRHAIETTNAMIELLGLEAASGVSLTVLTPLEPIENPLNISVTIRGRWHSHFWEQLSLPIFKRGVLINMCNSFPLLTRRQIAVVHDASMYAMPAGYTRAFVIFYRALLFLLRFKSSTRIVTDSEFSRGELARYTGINASKIMVIHCGADHWNRVKPDISVIGRLGLAGRKYLLAVASANPNKNLGRLVQAYSELHSPEVPLVLVGGINSRVFAPDKSAQVTGIVRAGYVNDQELAALYSSATAFVFPSLYEGFGLPPLEAMSFGCPVISSREASLPEVCGEAALYCDAFDVTDIANAMRLLLSDSKLRTQLITAGTIQSAKFKWKTTAQAMLDLAKTIS